MTLSNFTCIAKGHFLLKFVMYKFFLHTDYIIHSSSDSQIFLFYARHIGPRASFINYSPLGEILLFNLRCPLVSQTFLGLVIFSLHS